MELVVDRIEDEYVVCEIRETNRILNLPKEIFPSEVKDGDFIEISVTISSNNELKDEIKEKMDRLWE